MVRSRVASLFVLAVFAFGTRGEDGGLPMLRVIPQSEHHGGPQMFDVAQDRRGVLYFGNLKGVLTYDGAWWGVTELPNHSAVFAVESDDAGVVAAGGVGEFGFLADGRYRSLLAQLPAAQRDVGEVRGLCTSGRGFVFTGERSVIEWNGGAPRVIAELPGPTHCRRIGGSVVLWSADGLHRIEGGHLFGAGLQGRRVDAAVETNGGNILAAVRGEGLFLVDRAGNATRIDNEASSRVARATVTDTVRLRDGFAITTHEGSVLLLDGQHALREVLDHDAGLPDTVISSALVDAEGALWLACDGSIVRVDLAAPLTVLDARRGVAGMPNGVLSDRGRLWIATSRGLFVLDANRAPGSGAQRIDRVPAPVWWVIAVDDGILAGTSAGVFHLRDDGTATRIAGTESDTVFELLRSKRDPSRVWVATRKGLARLHLDRDWRLDAPVAGAPAYPRGLVESGDALWTGTVFNGVIRVDAHDAITQVGSGEMSVAILGGRLVAIRNGQFLHIDAQRRLVPDPVLGNIQVPGGFLVAAEDGNGDVWLGSDPARVVGHATMDARPLPAVIGSVSAITRDASGAMWIAAQNGLYRGAPSPQTIAPPTPLIRASAGLAPLPHDFGRLRIEFAPVTYGEGVRYQYRLEPADKLWSDWTAEPFIDYTRLGGGQYTFHLRTRNASGAVSDEASWAFSVLPPWYRKPLAITLFTILALALIALIVKLRTRALRRQADRLRALIAERTQELSEANQHLERLALLDDLTGIPNRRYFDRALARAWETARDHRASLSVILLDIDHFKNLNDEYGHAAGDESLVHLGRLLAQKIRRSGEFASRSGDVVARIGGEEFAILLAASDAESALRTAETLRTSIAEMEIFFDANPIHLSVSCGVATMLPGETDSADVLVRRADAALYAAKAAGRNCVRSAA
jgi:diguanylate cyclase (GGDEF)-like protein